MEKKNKQKAGDQCFKKILQDVHQENVTLNTLIEFRANYPDTLWTDIIYSGTGDSILHVAARLGKEEIVQYILENWPPFNVNIRNYDCKTPLHEAAQFTQLEIVKILLNHSAEVDAIKRADWTPLMLACTKSGEQSLEIISTLLDAGASCNWKNKDGWTPLHLACRTGDINIVKLLLNHTIEFVHARTNNGRTVLHIACLHGNLDTVELLLNIGKGSVHDVDDCGTPPVHDAVCSGSKELVRVLVKNGAKISAVNNVGLTCLHIAAGAGLTDMIQFLILDLNMNPNVVSDQKMTPLHFATRNKKYDAVETLKQLGANPNVSDVHLFLEEYLKTH